MKDSIDKKIKEKEEKMAKEQLALRMLVQKKKVLDRKMTEMRWKRIGMAIEASIGRELSEEEIKDLVDLF